MLFSILEKLNKQEFNTNTKESVINKIFEIFISILLKCLLDKVFRLK